MGHGYVFSMAVGTIGEWLKGVPPFFRGRTVDSEGGGGGGWQVLFSKTNLGNIIHYTYTSYN